MASELAFVLVNPYTIAKSRTGGVIGRFISRTGLDIVAVRVFTPGPELVKEYAALISADKALDPKVRDLLAEYIRKEYGPDADGCPRRVLMILLEGEEAIRKVREVAGPLTMGGGETIRDTFGDYVADESGQVRYFEPAVMVGADAEDTAAILRVWMKYSATHGGTAHQAIDAEKREPGWQRTLVLIKPDNFRFPTARPGNIIDMLSRSGLRIIAAKVHRMSVAQAEEFYGPVRQVLQKKMRAQVSEKARRALEAEFGIEVPEKVLTMLEDQLGPALGDEQFFQIVKFMTGCYPPDCKPEDKTKDGSNKCLALVYCGVGAVEKIRKLLGATDPSKAQPGSVRREFGHDIMVNAAHASDSSENADREIRIVKPDEDLAAVWVKQFYGG